MRQHTIALLTATILAGAFVHAADAKSGAGSCGENKYWSKTMRQCMDARVHSPPDVAGMRTHRWSCTGQEHAYTARCVMRRSKQGGE